MSNRTQALSRLAAGVLLASACTVPLWAAPLTDQVSGQVHYVTGGIGDEEDAAIKAMMHDYSVSMTFAQNDGGRAVYLSDVPVTVRQAGGAPLLSVKTGGPYLLVRLPAGSYTVEASHAGQVESRKLTVSGHATQSVVFEWR